VLIGQSQKEYMHAAKRQAEYLLHHAPRCSNQAISHRRDEAQLWSDFGYMAPPFLTYYGVAVDDASIVKEAVRQCSLYREALQDDSTGLWKHIAGDGRTDPGLWGTGNAWAAAGMARVLATISHWSKSTNWSSEKKALEQYIGEIIDGAMETERDQNGMLRNYLHSEDLTKNYGDGSCTALLAATVYRMAVLAPKPFAESSYIGWADGLRLAIASNLRDGLLAPTVDPLKCDRPQPIYTGSPEGQSFVVLLYAAYRDYASARGLLE
jgi:rhamnogalacturonyl hydrolase YesR